MRELSPMMLRANPTYDQHTTLDDNYNAANRMDTITKNDVVQAEYKYNALGQQVNQKSSVI